MKRRLMQRQVWLTALTLVAILAVIISSVLFIPASAKDKVVIVQSVITSAAILVGGAFALFKLQLFRDFQPHLTISNAVSHRRIGESYVHIDVTATLHNSSKVKMELREGFFRLQQVAPAIDEEVEALYAQVFWDQEHSYLQWPTLDDARRDWDKGMLIVEPGESHQETYEFIVSRDVESVIIHTYFYNPYSSSPEGWGATTVHDIISTS